MSMSAGILDDPFAALDESLGIRGEQGEVSPIELAETAFNWPWTDWQKELLLYLVEGDWSRLQVLAPPRHRKPLHISTKVLMADGSSKRLDKIQIGDKVITKSRRPAIVTGIHNQGHLPIIRIVAQNGRKVISALDHPFLTTHGWVEARNLKTGDVLKIIPERKTGCKPCTENTIQSIENVGEGYCKCLSVNRDSSFTANGFIVHNSVIGSIYCAIRIGEDPDTRVMVASHTRDYSILLMNQIENIMKLPAFKRAYGDLIPSHSDHVTWARHERHIANRSTHIKDPTMLALSPDSGTPGYGADIIIGDDLVTQANSSSPTKRKHIIHWVFGSLMKRLEPDGQMLIIGARFYRDDLYGQFKRSSSWETREYIATAEEPLWPYRWGTEELKQKELEDPVFFSAQYQQRPRSLASGTLNTDWFQYWVETPPLSNMSIFCGIDPIIKEKGSKFAYVVVGRSSDGIIYVLDSYSERHKAIDQPRLLDAIYDEWQPHAIAWESNGPQEAVMELTLQQVNRPLNMIKVPSMVDKYLRLSSIAGHLRQGKLLIPGNLNDDGSMEPDSTIKKLYQAWGEFPGGDDDILDAFEKAVKLATQGPPPAFGNSRDADATDSRRIGQHRRAGGGILKPTFGRVFRGKAYATLPPDQ